MAKAKAVSLVQGNLTKKEIAARKEAEQKLKGKTNKLIAPAHLNKMQKKLFKEIIKELEVADVLGNIDVYLLAEFVVAIDRLNEIEIMINNDIELLKDKNLMSSKSKYSQIFFRCCNELSVSVSGRAKLAQMNIKKDEDEEDELLKLISAN